jgi:hypothetical protein
MFDMQKLNEELPSKLVSYPSRLSCREKIGVSKKIKKHRDEM